MSLVVRTQGDAAALVPALRQAIWSVDKDQPIVRVAMMDDLLAGTEARRGFALILLQAFALTALILAAAGIYGVLRRQRGGAHARDRCALGTRRIARKHSRLGAP